MFTICPVRSLPSYIEISSLSKKKKKKKKMSEFCVYLFSFEFAEVYVIKGIFRSLQFSINLLV